MDDTAFEGLPLPKLVGNNYSRWKLKMKNALEARSLDSVVYGDNHGPNESDLKATGALGTEENKQHIESARNKIKEFKQLDAKARTILTCCLDDKHLDIVVDCNTSRQIWDRLRIEFVDRTATSSQELLTEYFSYKKKHEQSISEYVARIDSMASRLKEAGHPQLEESIIVRIVQGLTDDYDAVIRFWDMTPKTYQQRELLIQNLKKEERRLQESKSTGVALMAKQNGGGKSNSSNNGSNNGNNNRKLSRRQRIEQWKKEGHCKHCNQKGHWWKECPTRPKDQDQASNSGNRSHSGNMAKAKALCTKALSTDDDEDDWYLDSGASHHYCGRIEWFSDFETLSKSEAIKYGDGKVAEAIGKGTIKVLSYVGSKAIELNLEGVRYVPNISYNLISWGKASRKGLRLSSHGDYLTLEDQEEVLVTGKRTGVDLWKLNIKILHAVNFCKTKRTLDEWHQVLGHPNTAQIKNMMNKDCANGLEIVEVSRDRCGGCELGKGHHASHPSSRRVRATEVLERVHTDLVGKVSPVSNGGAEHFMLLKDEYSGYMFVNFLSTKKHLFHKVKEFIDRETALTHRRIRFLQSDHGSEFDNHGVKVLCAKEGIIQEFSAPYTPQQNGIIERANRTVIETARTLLQSSGLPLKFWSEAVNTAVYLRNRTTNSLNGDATPYELYRGHKPNLSHLIRFGEEVHILDNARSSKFAAKTIEAYMVGYDESRINTYRCLLRHKEEIVITSDVVPAKHRQNTQQQTSGRTFPLTTFFVVDEPDMTDRNMAPVEPSQDDTSRNRDNNRTGNIDLPDISVEEQRRHCTNNHICPDRTDETDEIEQSESESVDSAPQAPELRWKRTVEHGKVQDEDDEQRQLADVAVRSQSPLLNTSSASSVQMKPKEMRQHVTHTSQQTQNASQRAHFEEASNVMHREVVPLPPVRTSSSPDKQASQQPALAPSPSIADLQTWTQQIPEPMPMPSSLSRQQATGESSGNSSRFSPQRVMKQITEALKPSQVKQQTADKRSVPRRNVKSVYMRNMLAVTASKDNLVNVHDDNTADNINEPKTVREALESDHGKLWKEAMDSEFGAHAKNGTWETMPLPNDAKEITCKWLFKVKYCADGSIDRFKARIVARGFSQVEGKDYGEIFAPVVRMDSIRLLFSICAQQNLEFAQFDVTTAFLNGDLDEELYLTPPEGLNLPPGHTCRLRKSLYGLKQAPRCWNNKLVKMLELFDMHQTSSDPCVFVGHYPDLVYLGLYVDDGILFARNRQTIDRVLGYLKKHFEIKEVNSKCFIGFEIVQNKQDSSIFLHQRGYIKRVLERFGMINSKATTTPLEAGHTLNKPETLQQEPITDIPYAEALGNLLYCAILTRPDLAFALSVLSKFTKCPREQHWIGLKRVMRYLRGTMDVGLLYKPIDNPRIICYTDADYAGDHENRRSTSGVVTFINTGPVTFKAKQQACVSLSTTESEYIAATVGAKDIIWLQRFVAELDHPIPAGASLMCDNQGAIKLIKNPEFHERTKHIEVRYHFIREKWATGTFDLRYVETDKQRADILTKALSSEKHHTLMRMLGCYSLNSLDYEAKN